MVQKIIFGRKNNVGSEKKFWVEKIIFSRKNIFGSKKFFLGGTKIILGQKNFWVEK